MKASHRTAAIALLVLACACARTIGGSAGGNWAPAPADVALAREQIAATLAHGARAWNAGALDDFLSDYVQDTSTTYVTSRGVLHGVEQIRRVYASRFAPGARRDSLHFEALEVDLLGPEVANAIAYYVLMRGDSVTQRGPTSLVMRRSGTRWRIVHDHSS